MRQFSTPFWIPISLLIFVSEYERNLYVYTAGSVGKNNRNENNNTLSIGKSLNIFSRYGYLSVTMKIVARDNSEPLWVFREPTIDILTNIEPHTVKNKDVDLEGESIASRNTAKRDSAGTAGMATDSTASAFGNFHMEFCDNLDQLVQAYLRDFHFERFDKPWRAFSASWHPESIARHFGLGDISYTRDRYSYVLVRLNRYRKSVQLDLAEEDCASDTQQVPTGESARQLKFNDHVDNEIRKLDHGDTKAFSMFIQRFGSHFIQSYSTGDSLYQVFVFRKTPYQQMKKKFVTQGIKRSMSSDLMDHFSPMRSVHIGEIRTVSGNDTIEDWCSENLIVDDTYVPYLSLLRLHTEPYLFQKAYNLLQDEALLKIQLNSIERFIRDSSLRHWFQQALDNLIHLWDSNL